MTYYVGTSLEDNGYIPEVEDSIPDVFAVDVSEANNKASGRSKWWRYVSYDALLE